MNEIAAQVRPEHGWAQSKPQERPSPEAIEKRYRRTINALVDESRESDSTAILVDVLAWTIARSIIGCRTRGGAGDLMRRIGDYVCKLVDRQAAQGETEKAREEGRLPH
ncbi:hypothetical protein SBBP1_1010011 [Burkholderiales bacterium]|nr:hypothetical protein SBBP1_1010011 [Burkholderiales bacterium]